MLRDGVYQEEHRRIRQRLARVLRLASRDAGFPSALGALIALADEIEALLPVLTVHFNRGDRALREAAAAEPERLQASELLIAEHRPLLRELTALLESTRRVIEDLRAGQPVDSLAEALKAYLSACVEDILAHEDAEYAICGLSDETPEPRP